MLAAAQGTVGGVDPLAAYDYHLPPERIAQRPAPRRDQSRLLVLPRRGGPISHQGMADFADRLRPGDLLVLNDTKVVPARLTAFKPTGGRVEILLLSPANPRETSPEGEVQEVLLRSHRPVKAGARLSLAGDPPTDVLVLKKGARGKALVRFPSPALALAEARGDVPLPPYIKRPQGTRPEDRERYQTVYARRPGAAAAPTAGLHLTNRLLAVLRRRGVETAALTLHVGYGTFAEPAPEDLAAGRLHAEWVEVPEETCRAAARTRERGGRVTAVGTTSLRALEWAAGPGGIPRPRRGWCDLLIGEGYSFRAVDGLLTNFHLPRTTLLMLTAALAGRDRVLAAYAEAVKRGYRFYSFGDAMLII